LGKPIYKKVTVAVFILLTSIYIGFVIYNTYFHPIEKLSENIKTKQFCNEGIDLVNQYINNNNGIFKANYRVINPLYRNLKSGDSVRESTGHFIYQGPMFIGTSMRFRCNHEGIIEEVVYE